DGFIERLGGGPKGSSALAERYRAIPETDAWAIEANGLTKVFGEFTAAQDMNFRIPRGQIFGLLGPNGAGKSTLARAMLALVPHKGRILVDDAEVATMPRAD
ncbi:ATP-binding cassette domain-containing protein, partial [Escherichia coli]|nr:ATP-binding cassette domain-containing protein [Escherichia coli]